MNQYSFENKLSDYTPNTTDSLIQDKQILNYDRLSKYETALWEKTFKSYEREDDYSVYTGSSGVALALLLFADRKSGDEQRTILEKARKLIPIHKLTQRTNTFLCGDAGPLAIAAVIEHKLGNESNVKVLVNSVIDSGNDILDINSNIPNELLYGRVGYLYALLYLKEQIKTADVDDRFIEQIIDVILQVGQIKAKEMRLTKETPLMFEWHDSNYLGAAHGISGILYIILQAHNYVGIDALNKLIKPTIDYLVRLRFRSGNYPSSLGSDRDNKVQWCHGAPGYTHLFCQAYKVFNEQNYLQYALETGEIVWERGILTKGYSICHGVAGNAYTFLQLYKTTSDEKHLYRALQFAGWVTDYTTSHEFHYPDRPLSLFEGLAGRFYFIVDIQQPANSKFPGYEI